MRVDYKHFSIRAWEECDSFGAELMYNNTILCTLCSRCTSKPQALQTGIAKFREMLSNELSASEGKPCTLRVENRIATQLADGCWLVDNKVYCHKEFIGLFVL